MRKLTYKKSGVDSERANEIIATIGQLRKKTTKKHRLLNEFGDFGAAFDLSKWQNPVIVSTCDGVGTKVELLLKFDHIESIGKDLVAMNVNDILCSGANPVLFLDYLSSAKLDKRQILRFVAGMIEYLVKCDCILAGGETAEMPGVLPTGVLELSGFCVGVVEKDELITQSEIRAGDLLIAFPSSGFHANGFSLIRKVISENEGEFSANEIIACLSPTKLYWHEVEQLRKLNLQIKGLAHISGGGLAENLQRVLLNFGADIKLPAWEFQPAQKLSTFVSQKEMLKTFNMGVGFVAILSQNDARKILAKNQSAFLLGKITNDKINIKIK